MHSGIAVLGISLIYLAEVMLGIGSGFVMDNHLHSLAAGIGHHFVEIVVRISLGEAEVLGIAHPVTVPADVPAFNQHTLDVVFGCEVDVALGALGGCSVLLRIFRVIVPGV